MGQVENMSYNLTNITNADNIFQITEAVNDLTDGWFGLLILISFFMILIVSYKNQPMNVRVTSASFLTAILSMLFRVLGFTSDLIVLVFVLITAVSYIAMFYSPQ